MHITALCPHCKNRYKVDPGLRGKRMRCPNSACGFVFLVEDIEQVESKTGRYTQLIPEAVPIDPNQNKDDAPSGKPAKPRSANEPNEFVTVLEAEVVQETPPSVGTRPPQRSNPPKKDVVPTLSAEIVDENKLDARGDAASWREPPPVRRNAGTATPPPTEPAEPASPLDETPSWQEPPPVRRGRPGPSTDMSATGGGHIDVFEADAPRPALEENLTPAPPSRLARHALKISVLLLALIGLGVLGTVFYAYVWLGKREQSLFLEARHDYQDKKFVSAAGAFDKLIKDFPASGQVPRYRIYGALSQLRDRVSTGSTDAIAELEELNRFIKENKDNPPLKEFYADINDTYRQLVEQLIEQARKNSDSATLARARAAFAESQTFKLKDGNRDGDSRVKELLAEAQNVIAQAQKRQQALDQIGRMLAEPRPSIDTVARARDIAEQEGLKDDADAKRLIGQLDALVRQSVRYVAQRTAPNKAAAEPAEASLLFAPLTGAFARAPSSNRRIILALVRGVLYGLDQGNGEVRWVTRVGIDTTALPIRLPASPTSPELFLVLSAARNTVMTLMAQTGQVYWEHKLSGPCLGRPVIVGPWAYVPTYDGRVYEIETVQGYLQGYFDLGQPLSVGGVWQEGTDLVYFPGDSDNLYVLDTALTQTPGKPPREKNCVMILHTGHPSGSLRSEPIIINRPDPFARDAGAQTSWPPFLILSQTDGLNNMKLRVFNLPIESPDAQPVLRPEPRVSGWSWFQPYHDGEKLAFVTDVGVFGLFGINQVRNDDEPIFLEFSDEQKAAAAALGRAQVVTALENDFWVLVNGELQRMHFDLFGQKMVPLWASSLALGSPLHTGQLDENGKTLFVVTHDLKRQAFLTTAVDAEHGKILWQRQLGLDCSNDPLAVAKQVVAVDRSGGVFAVDAKRERLAPGQDAWWKIAAFAAKNPAPGTPYLFVTDNGAALYSVSVPEKGTLLTVRKYRFGGEGEERLVQEKEQMSELPTPLAGPPAIGPQSLLLPLADRTIQRIALPLDGASGVGGPDWRSSRADEGARAYVVAVAADEFLTTDGSRGITHWKWPLGKTFSSIPENRMPPTAELPARIIAAPVIIPQANPNAELRVAVADADGNLWLLRGPELKRERVWALGGAITAGPFLRGQRIGCVVDRRKLVWIDPARDKELWRYAMPGGTIVGEPQMLNDMLVLSNLYGRFVGLDPEKGQPRGSLYSLQAKAAPVATPVAYGPDEAFVPLTDGTVFLLPLAKLRQAAPAQPKTVP